MTDSLTEGQDFDQLESVLYFLDPWVGNIDNQKHTIDLHLNKICKHNRDDLRIYVAGHEKFQAYIIEKKYNIHYIAIPEVFEESERASVVERRILSVVKPQLILSYEANTEFLQSIFRNIPVYSESWGALSRFPYPAMIHFDEKGVYEKSTLCTHKDIYQKHIIGGEEIKALHDIRTHSILSLSKTLPDIILNAVQKLEGKTRYLLPLQADNHISFDNCCDWKNHKSMLVNILDNLSPDVDLIVTQHPDISQKVISDIDVSHLRSKYKNFIYFNELEQTPFVSQWLLLFVDGIMTVSSGLAFQSALLGLPVVALGNAHINAVASLEKTVGEGLSDYFTRVNQFILSETDSKADAAVWKFLTQNIFLDEYMFDQPLFLDSIHRLINAQEKTYLPTEYATKFKKWFRHQTLEKFLNDRKIPFHSYQILEKAAECKALSFDLFDTLVERPFFDPHDLFMMAEFKVRQAVENNSLKYFQYRRKAEEEARKARNWNETTLEQIYYQFQKLTGLNDQEIDIIKEIELDMEETVLTRKDKIHRVFNWGKRMGKVVSIITDIYHDKPTIERFLNAVKIKGYDYLYVSADLDMRKHDGTIYPLYLKDMKVKHDITIDNYKNLLHIGDNPTADIKMALEYKMRAHHIHKSSDLFRQSQLGKIFSPNINKRWVTDSIVMGMISNKLNENLSDDYKESLFGNKLHSFGYIAGGVMMMSFVQYVIEKIKNQPKGQEFEKVAFVARDGYIFKEIYDLLKTTDGYKDLPPSEYLVLSRRASALGCCYNIEDLKRLLHLSFGVQQLSEFLMNRFGTDINLIPAKILKKHHFNKKDVINYATDVGRVSKFIEDISDIILERCAQERAGLTKYFDELNIKPDTKMCLVDIGYSGTIQQNINKLFGSSYAGYYMLTHEAPRHLMDGTIFEGWLASYDEQRSANYNPINDYIFFFETLLSSADPSITSYTVDKNGDLVKEYQYAEDENVRVKFIQGTHEGIMDFVKDYCKIFNKYTGYINFSQSLAMNVIFKLAQKPLKADAKLFLQLNIENKFGGGDASLIYTHPDMFKTPTEQVKQTIVNKSQWKEGAKVLLDLVPDQGNKMTPLPAIAPVVAPVVAKPVPAPSVAKPPAQAVVVAKPPAQPVVTQAKPPVAVKPANGNTVNFTDSQQVEVSELSPFQRKMAKLKRDPRAFFEDSKNPLLNKIGKFIK